MNKELHEFISKYLDNHRREYVAQDFMYASYNAPNTMYKVANDLDALLLTLSDSSMRLWHCIMALVRRNSDPTVAISLHLRPAFFKKTMSRATYFRSLRQLIEAELLIKTSERSHFIINVRFANKAYSPKLVDAIEVPKKVAPPPPK